MDQLFKRVIQTISILIALISMSIEANSQPYQYLVQIDSIFDMSSYELEEGVYDTDSLIGLDSACLATQSQRFNDIVTMLKILNASGASDLMPMYPDDHELIDTLRGDIISKKGSVQRIWIIRSDSLSDSTDLAIMVDSLTCITSCEIIFDDTADFWPPTDPLHTLQTQFFNTTYNIDIPRAWEYSVGDRAIRVAIVDHGVDYTHPDLGGAIGSGNIVVDGYDFVDDDNNPMPGTFFFNGTENFERHGTPIAGIIAGSSNNGVGISGIAGGYGEEDDLGVSLVSLRVTNESESSRSDGLMGLDGPAIIKAIYHAPRDFSANIINCSFSSDRSSQWGVVGLNAISKYQVYYDAFLHNTLVVAARGNDGNDATLYPADFAKGGAIMAISGLDNNGNIETQSSFGNVSLSAPWTTGQTTDNSWFTPPYRLFNGTSNAAPVVAGVAALIMSSLHNRTIPSHDDNTRPPENAILPEDVMQILYAGANRTGMTGYSPQLGFGRLDAGQSLHIVNEPFILEHYNADESKSISSDAPSQPSVIGFMDDLSSYAISKIRKVTASFTLPDKYTDLDSVWLWVNAYTNGLPWHHPSWNIGGGHVESHSGRVWTFSTYVYELNDFVGNTGWYPAHPDNVVIRISVLGKAFPCEESQVTVTNEMISSYRYFAGDEITVGPNVTVELPGNAKFHASSVVHLTPGFHAERLSRAHAFIAPLECPIEKPVVFPATIQEPSELNIYPNPSNNSITVVLPPIQTLEYPLMLTVVDQLGTVVKSIDVFKMSDGENRVVVDISELASGAYYVRFQKSGRILVQPFIKLAE